VTGRQPRMFECEVLAVNAAARSLDARGISSSRKFPGASYILPYVNSLGGGIDFVPKTGDRCLVMATDQGGPAAGSLALVVGFETGFVSGIGGRMPDLTEGSVCLRSVDEEGNDAHVVAYAGGTLLLGSGRAARTVYSPLDSSIVSLFDNFELRGSGGHVLWNRASGSEKVTLDAEYRTMSRPESPGLRLRVRLGMDDANPLQIEAVNDQSSDSSTPPFRLRVTSQGEVYLEGESVNVIGRAAVTIDAPTVNIKGKPVLAEKDPI